MAYRDTMPDASGYRMPEYPLAVYVTDVTHAWPGTLVGHHGGKALVQTAGGEVVEVEPGDIRLSSKTSRRR